MSSGTRVQLRFRGSYCLNGEDMSSVSLKKGNVGDESRQFIKKWWRYVVGHCFRGEAKCELVVTCWCRGENMSSVCFVRVRIHLQVALKREELSRASTVSKRDLVPSGVCDQLRKVFFFLSDFEKKPNLTVRLLFYMAMNAKKGEAKFCHLCVRR